GPVVQSKTSSVRLQVAEVSLRDPGRPAPTGDSVDARPSAPDDTLKRAPAPDAPRWTGRPRTCRRNDVPERAAHVSERVVAVVMVLSSGPPRAAERPAARCGFVRFCSLYVRVGTNPFPKSCNQKDLSHRDFHFRAQTAGASPPERARDQFRCL